MAQAFVTIYKNDYQNRPQPVQPIINPEKTYPECYGREDYWYNMKTKSDYDYVKMEQAVRNQNIKRYSTTTYRYDYCRDWSPPVIGEDTKKESLGAFKLLDSFRPVYQKDKSKIKIMRPLQTSRDLLGFFPKADMYTPMTTFREHYGMFGFKRLEEADLRKKAIEEKKAMEEKKSSTVQPDCK
ncbi:unnamed protein product [Phyllotreta striolata]|uniref:Uncharacterized protein n=1 Tax=Phyllotreta striolata TaxID=444603 RepID=A0A9N9TI97_PHYSR|nr:unnamed protein product [Phyllotreta striolata]